MSLSLRARVFVGLCSINISCLRHYFENSRLNPGVEYPGVQFMADYKEKLDDLHRAAKRKAQELDEKLGVSGIVEDTARVAGDAARRGAKSIADGAEQLLAEAERL